MPRVEATEDMVDHSLEIVPETPPSLRATISSLSTSSASTSLTSHIFSVPALPNPSQPKNFSRYQCHLCSVSYMHECLLKAHLRSHSPPYLCKMYGERYSRFSDLARRRENGHFAEAGYVWKNELRSQPGQRWDYPCHIAELEALSHLVPSPERRLNTQSPSEEKILQKQESQPDILCTNWTTRGGELTLGDNGFPLPPALVTQGPAQQYLTWPDTLLDGEGRKISDVQSSHPTDLSDEGYHSIESGSFEPWKLDSVPAMSPLQMNNTRTRSGAVEKNFDAPMNLDRHSRNVPYMNLYGQQFDALQDEATSSQRPRQGRLTFQDRGKLSDQALRDDSFWIGDHNSQVGEGIAEENRKSPPPDARLEASISPPKTHPEAVSPPPSTDSREYTSESEGEISFVDASLNFSPTEDSCLETRNFVWAFARRIVHRLVVSTSRWPVKTSTPSQHESVSTTSQSSARDTPDTSLPTSSKRPRQDGEDDKDFGEDNDDDRAPGPKRKRESEGQSIKLFACPYAKFDLERYSERNHVEKHYRNCASKYLNGIPRVKQHLYRTHAQPPWYCGNCYKRFKSRECLNEHNRERPPCESRAAKYEEMMTDEQFQEIKRRSQKNSHYESWYRIFQILFPKAPKPLSPYVSTRDPIAVEHFAAFFRWYGPEEFFHLMRDRLERGEGTLQFDASTQAIVDEAFEIALPDYLDRLERPRQLQCGPSNVAGSSGQQIEDRQSGSTISPENVEGLHSDSRAMEDHSLPVSRAMLQEMGHGNYGEIGAGNMPPDLLQPFDELEPDLSQTHGWHLDPSEINQAFDAYEIYSGAGEQPIEWADAEVDNLFAGMFQQPQS